MFCDMLTLQALNTTKIVFNLFYQYTESQLLHMQRVYSPLEHWPIQFKFSVTWSCVSLPRHTTSSDWKCVLFEKFKSQYISVFQDQRHIFSNNLLSGVIQLLIKTQNVVDISVLRVSINTCVPYVNKYVVPMSGQCWDSFSCLLGNIWTQIKLSPT